jgi:hypothetical protein
MAFIQDSHLGEELIFVDVESSNNYFLNNGNKILVIKNDSFMPVIIMPSWVNQCVRCSNGLVSNEQITIPAHTIRYVGCFSPSRYNDSNMNVTFECTPITSGIKAAVLQAQ